MQSKTKVMDLYIEFEDSLYIGAFLDDMKVQEIAVSDMQVHRGKGTGQEGVIIFMTIKTKNRVAHSEVIHSLSKAKGINHIEEI